jgi:3-oxoacyl-[acyl-carrier-protein] synthase II
MGEPVVITGMGVVTPVGADLESFWRANVEGRSGLRLEERVDFSGIPCGYVDGTLPDETVARLAASPTATQRPWPEVLMLEAVRQALSDAGLEGRQSTRCGLVTGKSHSFVGATPAEFDSYARRVREWASRGPDLAAAYEYYLREGARPQLCMPRSLHAELAADLAEEVVPLALEATCTTGLRIIGEAESMLRQGHVEWVVAAASSSRITPYLIGTYAQMMALSRWKSPPELACRPFDKRRDGMVLGEGAGAIIFETAAHAARRGARQPYAQLLGCGFTSGGVHPTRPEERRILRAIEQALATAGVGIEAIDAINAHGTSTKLNDLHEARALHEIFGARLSGVGVSACKSILGHSSIAAGLIESIAAALSIARGTVFPVPSCLDADPACAMPIALQAVQRPVRALLKNAFGFGGQYASLVMGSYR